MVNIVLIDQGIYSKAIPQKLQIETTYIASGMDYSRQVESQNNSHAERCGMILHSYCPSAKLLSIDVFGDRKWAQAATIVTAIKLALCQNANIIFIGMATTSMVDANILEPACKLAKERGCIVVAPVDNYTADGYPAKFETVIGVIASNSINGDKLVYLGKNNIDVIANGFPLINDNKSKQRRIPMSSYAASRCAGIIANLWSEYTSDSSSDLLKRFKKKYCRRISNCFVYFRGHRFDFGGLQRFVNLRCKKLILDKYKSIHVRHILKVGSGLICHGMSLSCKVSTVNGQMATKNTVNKLRSTIDSVIITGRTRKKDAYYWIDMAQKYNKNIVVTTRRLAQRFQNKLSLAKHNGCKIWTPGYKILSAPRWYLNQCSAELPLPCIMIISNGATGVGMSIAKENVNQIAIKNNDSLMWVTDTSDGWLAGFDFCIKIDEITHRCSMPLDLIIGIIRHELRRRIQQSKAKAIGVVTTQPLLLPLQSGQIIISPWTQLFLDACCPQAIAIINGPTSLEWLEKSYLSSLSAQVERSHISVVDSHETKGNEVLKAFELNETCIQTNSKKTDRFTMKNLIAWERLYQLVVSSKNT